MWDGLSTGPCTEWPGSGLSRPVFSGPNDCAGRFPLPHPFLVSVIHRGKVLHVFQKYIDVEDVVEVGSDRLEHELKAHQDPDCLGRDVRSGKRPRHGIDAGDSTDDDEITRSRDVAVGSDRCHRVLGREIFDGFDLQWGSPTNGTGRAGRLHQTKASLSGGSDRCGL